MATDVRAQAAATGFDPDAVRAAFPILGQEMNGRPMVFLDSGASTQKPEAVIAAEAEFYRHDYANIHRGVYDLSQRASDAFDGARRKVQAFLGAADWREIVFTRNTTEAINLVAWSFLEPRLQAGDEILVTTMEHHSNIVPWQLVAMRHGAKVVAVPITDPGELDLAALREMIGPRTRMLACTWVSNVLGTVNPVAEIVGIAHAAGVPVLLDAAQAVQHVAVDVQAVGADFLAFSAHKIYGPSGVGVLYGKREHLEAMPPWQGGGGIVDRVTFEGTTYGEIPFRFEAGTPDIAGVHALGAALDWFGQFDIRAVEAHETRLMAEAGRALQQIPGLHLLGDPEHRTGALSFWVDGLHHQDVGAMLDLDGIAIRTGHHCAQPLHRRFGLEGSARASFGIYNNEADVVALAESLRYIVRKYG
ncbi:MAG TPA: SufS family cysteine desulfurase [Geminicoccus sp.]|uniref:aminotransferase class V-fold PLP-dependent enzyme n=1 Tax=Geminicoccus sp. TaxID=2024832 RepID=UPI002C75BB89|nr:SufS family cysteine desulfurase [Geminicoccus sp.]HWL69270.1 SufS family cysteine desulfurase [Geminicoccus sp.]